MNYSARVQNIVENSTVEERRELYTALRQEFPIHALEQEFGTTAEVILEAISRATDLSKRGIRGLITEAAFKELVIANLQSWEDIPIPHEQAYDFLIQDDRGTVSIQVKMQRRSQHQPMLASSAQRKLFSAFTNHWVVETQKTRAGQDATGNQTRPYRFGEFDLLAVSLQPSCGSWDTFMYTVGSWLIPDLTDASRIFKFQPVSMHPDAYWTNDLETAISWFRSGLQQRLYSWTPPQVHRTRQRALDV